jgi:plastocyanin
MDGSVFYIVGGALIVAALALSWVGVRGRDTFPPSRRTMTGVLAAFGLLVAVTAAYAVANAREEEEHRNDELAHEEAEAAEAEGEGGAAQGGGASGQAPPAAQSTFELTSPEDGSLVFEPDSLQTTAGNLTIAYANPSPVPHSVAVEDVEEQLLGESDTITGSEAEISVDLVPGEYVFFCTVPGHREAGMEGAITAE